MPQTKTEYTVRRTLEHDGTRYQPGAKIELAAENAAYLLGRGDIIPGAGRQDSVKKTKTAPKDGASEA